MRPDLLLWLSATVAIFLAAAGASRAYVGASAPGWLALALILYTAGNLMMLKLMREAGMGVAISVSAIAQLVLVNLIAVLFFGERPSTTQWAGLALGVAAMALILLPVTERR